MRTLKGASLPIELARTISKLRLLGAKRSHCAPGGGDGTGSASYGRATAIDSTTATGVTGAFATASAYSAVAVAVAGATTVAVATSPTISVATCATVAVATCAILAGGTCATASVAATACPPLGCRLRLLPLLLLAPARAVAKTVGGVPVLLRIGGRLEVPGCTGV